MEIGRYNKSLTVIGVILLALALTGCGGDGGSGNTSTATTGTMVGTLATMALTPPAGSTFIPEATAFKLYWPAGTMPPPTFSVTLQEFFEPVSDGDDSEAAYVDAQDSTLTREGTTYVWDLTPGDGGLDDGSVYLVEVDSGTEQVRSCYIIDGGRAEFVGTKVSKAAKAAAKKTAGHGRAAAKALGTMKVHLVHRDPDAAGGVEM